MPGASPPPLYWGPFQLPCLSFVSCDPKAQGLIMLGPLTLFHTLLRRESITLPVCNRTFSTDQRLKRARVEDEHWGLRTGVGGMARHNPVGKDVT